MRDSSSSSWVENVKVLVPLVVLGSLAGGSAFYVFVNDWPLSLAFYYATSELYLTILLKAMQEWTPTCPSAINLITNRFPVREDLLWTGAKEEGHAEAAFG